MRVIKLTGVIISVRAGVFMAPGHNVSDGDAVITLWGRGRRARAAVRRVKDNAFTKRGFRRRCNNYFMGAAGGAHAPWCADYITIIPTRCSCMARSVFSDVFAAI